jgi:hypothetical protein
MVEKKQNHQQQTWFVDLILTRTVSAQISHDHMATAFHFLISNRGPTCAVVAATVAFHNNKKTIKQSTRE